MANIRDLFCKPGEVANTGASNCDKKLPPPEVTFLSNAVLTPQQIKDIETTLAALVYADNNRWYPLPLIFDTEDMSTAPKKGAIGSGPEYVTKEGYPGYGFLMEPGVCLTARIRTHNGAPERVWFYGQGRLYYTKLLNGNARGFEPAQIYLPPARFPGNSAPYQNKLEITFKNNFEFDSIGSVPISSAFINELNGLQDVDIIKAYDNVTPGEYELDVVTCCDDTSLFDVEGFDDAIAHTAVWDVKNKITGTPIVLTSVTKLVAPKKGWKVKINASDDSWADLDEGALITFALKKPSVLYANDVEGIESNVLTLPANN